MVKILIVYTTSIGNTQKMARSVADGANSISTAEVSLKSSDEATKEDVKACNALILGSPIRHRTADARIKKFIEDTLEQLWLTDEVVEKVGGVFSVGGGYGANIARVAQELTGKKLMARGNSAPSPEVLKMFTQG